MNSPETEKVFTRENRYKLDMSGSDAENFATVMRFMDICESNLLADLQWKVGPSGDVWEALRQWLDARRAEKDLTLYDIDPNDGAFMSRVMERHAARG